MKTVIGHNSLLPLLSNIATCGGTSGPLFRVAKLIAGAKEGDTLEEILGFELPLGLSDLALLVGSTNGGVLTPQRILENYGLQAHYQKITTEGTMVARELETDKQSLAHLALPLTDGKYQNNSQTVRLDSLVPLGPQKGQLVAHLGGVYSCNCTRAEIESVLAAQAKFLPENVWDIESIDYQKEAPELVLETQKAKKELGL